MGKYARFRRKGAKMRESVSGGVPFLAATQSLLARSHTSRSGIVTICIQQACLLMLWLRCREYRCSHLLLQCSLTTDRAFAIWTRRYQ